jgi:hypothetical protein
MLTPLIDPVNEPFAQIGGAKKRKGTKGKKTKGKKGKKGTKGKKKSRRHKSSSRSH